MPPSGIEPIDPTTLHVSGEFIEENLGAQMRPDGSVVVRLIGQQYSFNPQCVVVPAQTKVTFRGTSADVVHGFLVTGTNANAMLIPGYITTFTAEFSDVGEHLMPCHEFCGTGHAAMWARIQVVPAEEFIRLIAGNKGWHCG
jgi:cytochrome c oxidase subunit 2